MDLAITQEDTSKLFLPPLPILLKNLKNSLSSPTSDEFSTLIYDIGQGIEHRRIDCRQLDQLDTFVELLKDVSILELLYYYCK